MKKLRVEVLQAHEPVVGSADWEELQEQIDAAIAAIVWPQGADSFTINPVVKTKGTKIERNGVKPIKEGFITKLKQYGWKGEQQSVAGVGKVDAAIQADMGTFAIEWETGNISSSHRSLNRLVKGLLDGSLAGGVLILPSRKLYNHLTDRIGNFQELEPYFEIYKLLPITQGVLVVIEVEHDAESADVPRITQGIDGMSLVRRGRAQSGG